MAGKDEFRVRFWGVRGSLPTPGSETTKYGGNTSCVEVRCGDRVFIVDMGSGARPMGQALAQEAPLTADILISHYHWDHICGIPFCGILYDPRNTINFYGEARKKRGLKSILSGQMKYPYFPVGLDVFQAQTRYHTIDDRTILDFGDVTVKTAPLNHPQSSLAYRISYKGKSVVYCSDNEHQEDMPPALADLIQGCDLLIYDAAYTDDEYTGRTGTGSRIGWGHSTWDEAIRTAKHFNVDQLYIFHHDPMHTDKEIDRLVNECREEYDRIWASQEGKTVKLI